MYPADGVGGAKTASACDFDPLELYRAGLAQIVLHYNGCHIHETVMVSHGQRVQKAAGGNERTAAVQFLNLYLGPVTRSPWRGLLYARHDSGKPAGQKSGAAMAREIAA